MTWLMNGELYSRSYGVASYENVCNIIEFMLINMILVFKNNKKLGWNKFNKKEIKNYVVRKSEFENVSKIK